MSTAATIRLEGLAQHVAAIDRMGVKTARKVIPKAVRAGAKPQTKASRAGAPRRNGFLRRSITLVIRRYQGLVLGLMGQQRGKTFKNRKRLKAGGISGRNMAAPIHLVDQPVRSHAIHASGASQGSATRSAALAMKLSTGQLYRRSVRHPGHRGARWMLAAALASQRAAAAAFEAKFVDELEKETRPT